ncbi:hypothetical protein JS756_35415 [Streptomyces actuosus]|uniref:Carboxypeptidase regulatory-like domain-containing protein n=1 Tax=Streptomyces actuosus TaxID=1885 RepID=A0ABS2W1H3_STRAS|nr:hypothetical protein [Streptomyces actuosus]MBN0049262.1 hypothetical protein [Streptomyces actuosus]
MYLRTAATALTATVIGLTGSHTASAADGPGLSISVRDDDSDSTADGPLRQGAPVVITSDVDLTSLAADGNGTFRVKSPAFTEDVTVEMRKNSFGEGDGTISCDIRPGSYPVDVAGQHGTSAAIGDRGHLTITVKDDDGRYCDQAAGSTSGIGADVVAVVAAGLLVLAAVGYTAVRRRKTRNT